MQDFGSFRRQGEAELPEFSRQTGPVHLVDEQVDVARCAVDPMYGQGESADHRVFDFGCFEGLMDSKERLLQAHIDRITGNSRWRDMRCIESKRYPITF